MTRPPSPDSADHHWAWFLDVDGTLLEIESEPQRVTADPRLLALLRRLNEQYEGALALISGRSLEQIDDIFGKFGVAAAGSHGLEQRFPDGSVTLRAAALPRECVERVETFAAGHEGLLVEHKPFSVSVHYRNRPELEDEVLEAMEGIHRDTPDGFHLQRGKMVVEFLPDAADKGSAIRAFMEKEPFRGRRPVFAGDDATDEHGFAVVNELGGLSIRIGDAAGSAARWQLENVSDLRTWLQSALNLL
jgi:trehalose 6-phosphate phosphatase